MTFIHNNNPAPGEVVQGRSDRPEHIPMHPEDYEAHFAWVTAKRFQELVRNETFSEKPVYYRILRSCRTHP